MNPPDDRMVEFIKEHHILTLAVVRDNIPWCATCYYAWMEDRNAFIFTSDHDTRHVRDVVESGNFRVAGAIALETRIVGKIRGLQFSGELRELSGDEFIAAKKRYLRRFPVARMMPELHLWELQPGFMKMTDNRLGFGKKLLWTP